MFGLMGVGMTDTKIGMGIYHYKNSCSLVTYAAIDKGHLFLGLTVRGNVCYKFC